VVNLKSLPEGDDHDLVLEVDERQAGSCLSSPTPSASGWPRRRRDLAVAPAQKRLATLYAQEPSTTAAAYDLAAKARKTLPDDPELSELLGRLSYEKKEYPRAIQLLEESARKRPLDADSLFCLGMSQLQGRQKAEAREVLDQALVAGLQDPLAAEAKRALAELQNE